MDSILIALFNSKNKKIFNYYINSSINNYNNDKLNSIANNIRKELINIYKIISTSDKKINIYCSILRKLLNDYQKNYVKYVNKNHDIIDWMRVQTEPYDFLNFLGIIFNYKNNTKVKYLNYATNLKSKSIPPIRKMLLTKNDINNINPKDIIGLDELLLNDEINIKDYYPKNISDIKFDKNNLWKINSKEYYRKIEKKIILSSDFLIIHINSLSIDTKLNTKIIPILKIKLIDNKNSLFLNSIVIHHGNKHGGHYTCVYECKNIWYEYDDLRDIKIIGTFEEMCNYRNNYYLKNCTDLIYI